MTATLKNIYFYKKLSMYKFSYIKNYCTSLYMLKGIGHRDIRRKSRCREKKGELAWDYEGLIVIWTCWNDSDIVVDNNSLDLLAWMTLWTQKILEVNLWFWFWLAFEVEGELEAEVWPQKAPYTSC